MFREFFYYGSMLTISTFLGYKFLKFVNPDFAGEVLYNSVKSYHYCKQQINHIRDRYDYDAIKDFKKEVEMKPINKYIGYKLKDDTSHTCTDIKNEYFNSEEFDLMIIEHDVKNERYYKILSEKSDLENCSFKLGKPIFLQVEIEQYGKRISIHENLLYFYMEHNVILSKIFLEWYMKKFYSTNLSNEYKIHIIDDNINVFSIDDTQYIELYFDKDDELKYLIKLI
jgi:hypothetical protein